MNYKILCAAAAMTMLAQPSFAINIEQGGETSQANVDTYLKRFPTKGSACLVEKSKIVSAMSDSNLTRNYRFRGTWSHSIVVSNTWPYTLKFIKYTHSSPVQGSASSGGKKVIAAAAQFRNMVSRQMCNQTAGDTGTSSGSTTSGGDNSSGRTASYEEQRAKIALDIFKRTDKKNEGKFKHRDACTAYADNVRTSKLNEVVKRASNNKWYMPAEGEYNPASIWGYASWAKSVEGRKNLMNYFKIYSHHFCKDMQSKSAYNSQRNRGNGNSGVSGSGHTGGHAGVGSTGGGGATLPNCQMPKCNGRDRLSTSYCNWVGSNKTRCVVKCTKYNGPFISTYYNTRTLNVRCNEPGLWQ